ncbi:hypothetical protein J2R76_005803 [Bradyrhizobium sp. USDA 4532]|uniref:hypothetical protein n=1 Tax=unclassified Bradyrhizobium TaxID=2631580 RepID=UPI0020A1A63C|nr:MULTISPECIES: hypothetical protein [unclassified Bradyrhizobium]MCP1829103.1 hypothetical protein [Bradyrhizobium sp. USDA 4545]MCP1922212.1 hypothetical protein [Bradyrhizobium sp. USDA 4532]
MSSSVNLTKRERKRKLTDGTVVMQTRYVLNYREPRTSKRRQLFFEKQKDAQARRNQIIAEIETGTYAGDRNRAVTVKEIVDRWLESRKGEIKDGTLDGYRRAAANIVGPLLIGTPQERVRFALTGEKPEGAKTVRLLGDFRVQDLTTGDIRAWHKQVASESAGIRPTERRCFSGAFSRWPPRT